MRKINHFKYLSFGWGLLMTVMIIACNEQVVETKLDNGQSVENEVVFDSVLANEYGADAYGMKKYVIAFLKKGPNRDMSLEEAERLQAAHMENIGKMADAGQLVLAGPFFGDGPLRGIYIFNVESIEAAEALTNTDPAIQAGSLVMELNEWYGSAALMGVNKVHATLSETPL